MPKSKIRLSHRKTSRSRTKRAKKLKQFWLNKKNKETISPRALASTVHYTPQLPVALQHCEKLWDTPISLIIKKEEPEDGWETHEEFDSTSTMPDYFMIKTEQEPEEKKYQFDQAEGVTAGQEV